MIFTIAGIFSLICSVAICLLTGAQGITWLWLLPVSFLGSFLVAALAAFLFLWIMCSIVDLDVPEEKENKLYRSIAYAYADAIITLLRMRMHTEGLDKLPKEGRYVLVCNHLFELDPVVLYSFFKKSHLVFISKRENNSMFLVGKLMHKLNCQLINRENDREALKTILNCIKVIKDDQFSVAVFPEGYISLDGRLRHFRPGVFKIAMKSNVPIVVCTLQNTDKVFHNILRLKPTDVHLHLVDVIPPEDFKGHTAVDVSNRVYQLMLDDLGPDYVPLEDAE